jgi:heme/copper-type cytochrome/quinol oxidase subunit 2
MVASPANPLLTEISKLNTYTDPISISSESSRDLFYLNTSSFNFSILQNFFNKINLVDLPLNITFISNYFLFYFTGVNNYSFSDVSSDFYKNQYRPRKKGVSNMVKLHATGAIAMPTEVRMHLLASSKDVIHSWAIPSAGIKIDCVPGYSSHRIVIFLVSGIF